MPQCETSNFSYHLKRCLSVFTSVNDRWETEQGHSLGNAPDAAGESWVCIMLSKPKAKYLHIDYSKTFCLPSQLPFFVEWKASLPELKIEQGIPPAASQYI